ncbi:RluA family pseudouridine synthase [Aerococcus viridans]|uniref:RluA family pseudouridine synthase n=1 Tax=Aerococcus TaxID=1375 RepID=UPI003B21E130|nr:RluA family pseudouridine synthase [Aerococcus urinaeequi]
MDVPILYEDNHLLLVQKPVNIPVQEDQSGDKDLLTYLKEDIKYRYQKPGNVYLGLVHRLDRPVGGAMVFAKTSKAASRLSDQVRRNDMGRTYYAVVHGIPKQASNRLVDYLYKNRQKNIVSIVSKNHKEGKKAVLDYSVIASKDGLSLVSVQLQTGRPHQIRVQLAGMGTPIWGDQKYGQHYSHVGQQIALWAQSLTLEHPVKKVPLTVESPLPKAYPWAIW